MNYPSNSMFNKETPKKVTKVTKGVVIKREKPLLRRIFSESLKGVGFYILWDVVIPAAKSTLTDAVINAVEMIMWGESGGKSSRISRYKDRSYVSYNKISSTNRIDRERVHSSQSRNRHDFSDIAFETRADAEQVITTLMELIDQYEVASVSDFYRVAGYEEEWTDNDWGWDDVRTATIRRVQEGWVINMPKPIRID